MAAPVYLETLRSFPTTSIFNNRPEYDRFVNLVKEWKLANPSVKGGDLRYLLVERILILHVLIGRLHDRKHFWNGGTTSFQNAGKDHEFTMSEEDQDRKDKEFWRHYPELHRWQTDLLKLALANDISVNLTGDIGGVQSLFGAIDKEKHKRGSSDETTTID